MHAGFVTPQPVTVPGGWRCSPTDYAIRRYGERGHNIVHWTEFDRGGHFAAMEAPDLLVEQRSPSSADSGNVKGRGSGGVRWSSKGMAPGMCFRRHPRLACRNRPPQRKCGWRALLRSARPAQ